MRAISLKSATRKALPIIAFLAILVATQASAEPYPQGDPEKGAKVYKKCVACHMVGEGAKNRVGPHLNGMFARGIGALEGYRYSKGMMAYAAEAKDWTEENLDAYLESPRKLVKGGRMSFAGLRKAKDRHNVIAYLKQAAQ